MRARGRQHPYPFRVAKSQEQSATQGMGIEETPSISQDNDYQGGHGPRFWSIFLGEGLYLCICSELRE